jgi:hypothetical protein
MRVLAALVAIAACRGDDASTSAPSAPPTVNTPIDAAPTPVDAITFIAARDAAATHLDDDPEGVSTGTGGVAPRSRRNLEILLRSTPPGAIAVVDGRRIGTTPTYWEGEFTGRSREFVFLLPGHALARYKFVPTSSGIVHARLTQITSDSDAAMPDYPLPAEQPDPPPPPRRPVDAAPALPSTVDAAIVDGGLADAPIDAVAPRVGPPEP